MDDKKMLAEPFEQHRRHLVGVAFRMLGSLSEAEDAVQEAWLRLSRADTSDVANLRGWLTTVVARVCLDMLRSRKARREDMTGEPAPEPAATPRAEQEALMADSVGLAVLVVLETLAPAERLAFVLHDMFAMSFDEIATIVGRSPEAARQLASRARRRIQGGAAEIDEAELTRQRTVVDAFLNALRGSDFQGLLAVLDPDLVVRTDAAPPGSELRGAENYAKQATGFARMAAFVRPAMVDGALGLVFAPRGKLQRALKLTFRDGKIAEISIIMKPEAVSQLEISLLGEA